MGIHAVREKQCRVMQVLKEEAHEYVVEGFRLEG
jgi:hypothetical protein